MKAFIVGGGGVVGSASAFCLAARGLVDEIVLYDLDGSLAQSHAMDLSQSAALTSRTRVTAGGWDMAEGADLVINAAGLSVDAMTPDPAVNVCAMKPLIRSIAEGVGKYCPRAVVLSMMNPLDAFNYVLWKACGLPRRQFIALAANDSLRFRYALAEHLHVEPGRVDAVVIGEHSAAKLPLFSTVTLDGAPLRIPEQEQGPIVSQMNAWWQRFLSVSGNRTAAWTTGSSCALTVAHLVGAESGPVCCSCILEDGLSTGYPVLLDRGGVAAAAHPALTPDEAARFEAAKADTKAMIARVMDYLETHG